MRIAPYRTRAPAAPAPATIAGKLEVRDLSFSYAKQKVLDGVSLTLEPGRSLALVGRTAEWRELMREWDAARSGSPRCLLISGVAGVGKTCLVDVRR